MKSCDIGKKKKLDKRLRGYILGFAAPFALAGLLAGFYLGFGFVTYEAAQGAPLFDKIVLNIFISISCGAFGLIFGAFVGSTIYRFKERADKQSLK